MRKLLTIAVLVYVLAIPVRAEEFYAPPAPESAVQYMPDNTENFAQGFWYVVRSAIQSMQPSLTEACRTCISVIAAAILIGVFNGISTENQNIVEFSGVTAVSVLLFQPANSLISVGADTVYQISQYGKLLLPVISGALAAQGAVSKSAALYTATAFLDALLSSAVAQLLVPLLYIFLSAVIACCAFEQEIINNIRNFVKWLTTWGLKTVLYVFTGYISITGVVSGATDAAALKATKLTISGMVPVVGSIISDASEAVLVSAGVVRSSVGIYGLLAITAIWIGPFLQIGVQYLMLKLSAGVCETIGVKRISQVVKGFSEAMGMILAMVGTVSLIQMISTVCFMRGVG